MTRPFVPGFDALWEDKKSRLHNATRSVFLRLCQKARDAGRHGEFVLQVERDDVSALMRICPGPRAEFVTALAELTDSEDPMISLDGPREKRVLRILSWEDWALLSARGAHPVEDEDGSTVSPPTSSTPEDVSVHKGGRPRVWGSEADRSRARRARSATGNPTGNPTGNQSGRPETGNRLPTGNVTGYSTGNSGAVGGERGGVSGVQTQSRSEEIRREEKPEDARAGARVESDPRSTRPFDPVARQVLTALEGAPELARAGRELGLDLARVASDLATEALKEVMNGKVPQDGAAERVVVAIGEVDDKVRAAAATRRPWDAATIAARLVTFARTNLRKPPSLWREERQRASGVRAPTFGPSPEPKGGDEDGTVEPWRVRTDLAPPPPPKFAPRTSRRGPGPLAETVGAVLPEPPQEGGDS